MQNGNRAVLALDLQNELVDPKGKFAGAGFPQQVAQRDVLARAERVLSKARAEQWPLAHVRVGFRPDYVDVHSRSARFEGVRKNGALQVGTWGTEFHPKVAPAEGEMIFTKQSVNPFLTTGLLNWLVRRNVEEIVIFGVSTTQVVESTARHGDDIGLLVTVLEDCCAAADEDMHRFSAERVLPTFAQVRTSEDFLG